MLHAEAEVTPLAPHVRCPIAIIVSTAATQVRMVVLHHPLAMVEEILVLRAAPGAVADLVVIFAVLTMLQAEERAAVDALARRCGSTAPLEDHRACPIRAGGIRWEDLGLLSR